MHFNRKFDDLDADKWFIDGTRTSYSHLETDVSANEKAVYGSTADFLSASGRTNHA